MHTESSCVIMRIRLINFSVSIIPFHSYFLIRWSWHRNGIHHIVQLSQMFSNQLADKSRKNAALKSFSILFILLRVLLHEHLNAIILK